MAPDVMLDAGQSGCGELSMLIFKAMGALAPGQTLEVHAYDLAAGVEAVRLVMPGYAGSITAEGFKPLKELLDSFIENGGKLWVCPPCFNARGLDKEQVIVGATFAGSPAVVEFLGQGAASLSY